MFSDILFMLHCPAQIPVVFFSILPHLWSTLDDRSPMSSGSDTEDYSPPDSPPGPSCSNSKITNEPIINSNNHSVSIAPQTSSSSTSISTSSSSAATAAAAAASAAAATTAAAQAAQAAANSSKLSILEQQYKQQQQALQQHHQQQQQQQQQQQSQVTSNVIYPATALANLPQDVLVRLLQSGQIQLHNEDGGQQFITIPLSLMSTLKPDSKNANGNQNSPAQAINAKPTSSSNNNNNNRSSSSPASSSSASSSGRRPPKSKDVIVKTEVDD
ncbi:uncharacterized protein DDB_G0271670 isoform X7 [Armigeres subalbatus]|uniref:uncharacterized protein DDB_G0271670 isoform X7 n=1 Tax=Armigeres subalbatus TaxID=124917 RepID=UPI002ED172B5